MHQNRQVILDGMLSLQTEASFDVIHHYVLGPNASLNADLVERALHAFAGLQKPPSTVSSEGYEWKLFLNN